MYRSVVRGRIRSLFAKANCGNWQAIIDMLALSFVYPLIGGSRLVPPQKWGRGFFLFAMMPVLSILLATEIFGGSVFAQSHEGNSTLSVPAARAHWLSRDLIAWSAAADSQVSIRLASPDQAITEERKLEPAGALSGALARAYPHLKGLTLWRIPKASRDEVRRWLKGDVQLVAYDKAGQVVERTLPQIGEVLDELYANDRPLGARFDNGALQIALWAPTARLVRMHLFDNATSRVSAILPLAEDPATGIWTLKGKPEWNRKFYLYEVSVFVPEAGKIVTNMVTDPYSLNLGADSERTQIMNLDDADLKPKGWDLLMRPLPQAPEDRVLYELHVRDFSITDNSVRPKARGLYAAFANRNSRGMRHLRSLAKAGLSDVHLLPTYDCATIPERVSAQSTPPDLTSFPANSEAQQAAIARIKDQDGFNWCYDPLHYMAPEGSYASDPDGITRIVEFRAMVKGLADAGLGTILDVVFNHTSASGQARQSVLDRIVPGYYHRLDENGVVARSTCCANTATERKMMERLMLDSLAIWAKDYKISGFRFDLMGHHSRDNLLNVRKRLDQLSLASDGVDGPNLIIYGEGWNFGEVANDARFVQASQINMGRGSGIGTFNDRIRDAIRGGGVGDKGEQSVRKQGFASGLYTAPNALNAADAAARQQALNAADQIRAALAGSIGDYPLTTNDGRTITARALSYNGSPFGYASDPQEIINYAEAHDNQTLFDSNALKLPLDTSRADRVRWQNLAASIVMLSQGIPFLHGGQELLRSKSLDHNSFNSGDWFNRLNFKKDDNGWGRGLAPEADNRPDWPIARALLVDLRLKIGRKEILQADSHVRDLLKIRKSTPLFRLRSGQDVIDLVHFDNIGPDQIPGLIVMRLGKIARDEIIVVINATRQGQSVSAPPGQHYQLHDVLKKSADAVVRQARFEKGRLETPALTTAVFVRTD